MTEFENEMLQRLLIMKSKELQSADQTELSQQVEQLRDLLQGYERFGKNN
jgi:hypothetical protein